MTRSRKLTPVVEMARKATETELVKLGQQNDVLLREQTQLDDLMRYREEYLAKFRQGDEMRMSAKKALELRAFLAQLDQAIHSQKQQVSNVQRHVQHQQQNWMQARNKEHAIDSLISRYKSEETKQTQRREQRENDEHTSTKWSRNKHH